MEGRRKLSGLLLKYIILNSSIWRECIDLNIYTICSLYNFKSIIKTELYIKNHVKQLKTKMSFDRIKYHII